MIRVIDPHAGDVAIVHDYLTQRGGAERVVLDIEAAFPGTAIHTSLYEPSGTFSEYGGLDVRPMHLNRSTFLRHHHRVAFPLFAPAFSRLRLDDKVVICSSSGWAHGVTAVGKKIVYCHTPARWLYQGAQYLGKRFEHARLPLEFAAIPLRHWDRRAAHSASRYLVNSSVVRQHVGDLYGIEAELLPPPPGFTVNGDEEPLAGIEPGFTLCVSRLLEYKNVAQTVQAFAPLRDHRLVVVGDGPLFAQLTRVATDNVVLAGRVTDAQLRWLYRSASGLVASSFEDFGLTPLEAASFGLPTAALRWGGFLDTIIEGRTGLFFDEPTPALISAAILEMADVRWDRNDFEVQTPRFTRERFIARLQEIVREELHAAS